VFYMPFKFFLSYPVWISWWRSRWVSLRAHKSTRQTLYVYRCIEERPCSHCYSGKVKSVTEPGCVYL